MGDQRLSWTPASGPGVRQPYISGLRPYGEKYRTVVIILSDGGISQIEKVVLL